jgi:hypothetical protein
MKLTSYFAYVVTLVLLALSGVYHSSSFAYAAVLGLAVSLFQEIVKEKVFTMKDIKLSLPDDVKKKLTDLEVRLNTVEYGIKQRGF